MTAFFASSGAYAYVWRFVFNG